MKKINLGENVSNVHLIGIGGISMSGLAEILLSGGYNISGSDANESEALARLREAGAIITVGNSADNIHGGIDLVVHTAAVKEDNPERAAAAKRGLRIIDRARLASLIMESYEKSICVAGTHGKTTTTSIIADMCIRSGLDPTIQIGGYMGGGKGFNFLVGGSDYFVMEACEYAGSFLSWNPHIGVILNVDNDHMEYFKTLDNLIGAFATYANNIKPGGTLVINASATGFERITAALPRNILTFGQGGRFTADNINYEGGRASFTVMDNGKPFTDISIRLPGEHNVLNALAAAAAGYALGLTPAQIGEGISSANGTRRRYEYKGEYNGATIIDDYAHHPAEIAACLKAAETSGRLICLFQSHTYTRTRNLLTEFGEAFKAADLVALLPIYASREMFDRSITQSDLDTANTRLHEEIARNGVEVVSFNDFDKAETYLRGIIMPGDLLITMGAGDAYLVGESMLRT
jgi:UDP-N-acetylmuramate--alanine ligase